MRFVLAATLVSTIAGWPHAPLALRQEAAFEPDVPGRAVYEDTCSRCHGADGRGERAPWLIPFRWSYAQTLDIVRHGTACGMPAFTESELSDEAVHQLVDYLKVLTDHVEQHTEGAHDSSDAARVGIRGGR